ncbi:alkaline phosphatase family protein [Gimesia aquarii]|uniref:Type I phosphodiesterase / nucleotide pyrophosphatase n=1 Tax=Gimesia aquarii TaxID=2527964 RepID=A0A517WX16_9PLAN|nr:alkaline phosphatase family protein [Gimesia aquarii]QDU09816.1 Type I phosphodiesterase / nucleotide pyrophosphatase [Gimesia aquarii]
MKKVLLIIIDALATRVVLPALQDGKLPNIQKLVDLGSLIPECTSIFPSITPAATCSIVTGAYPFEHGISGAYWYDTNSDEIAYFGSDLPAIINEGMDRYINDFQVKLNMDRLQIPTLFERIEQHGALRDAVVNFMWYRGTVEHETTTPALLKLTPGVSLASSMRGPHSMFLGDFVSTPLYGTALSARGGLSRRFGFHDEATADYLLALAEQNALPDFTLAYFPNNDFDSHAEGPENALPTLQAFDEHLGQLFETQGGIEKMLEEFAILITGDHSQSDLDENPAVDLNEVLEKFPLVEAGKPWEAHEDMKVCPNMRSAQIYMRPELWTRRTEVIDCLLKCNDIDQVIWSDHESGLNDAKKAAFHVHTQDRGRLVFQPALEKQGNAVDCYGTPWVWKGDLSAVDAQVTSNSEIQFGDYPNAFERIATSFSENTGNLWVTARLGKEFCLPTMKCNLAGSHGSLHYLDSTAPLIAAGLPSQFELRSSLRIIDIAPICLQLLSLESPRIPGVSAIMNSIDRSS